MENDDLISGLKKGENEAFEILIEKYSGLVFNLSIGILRNREWADDISQEVFIEVFRSISKFKEESSLETWIYRITLNKCLNFEKKQKRFELMDGFKLLSLEKKEYWIREQSHPGIPEERKVMERWIYGQIRKLPESQRIALTLHKIQGMRQTEIAEVMDVSISAVESLVFRAMKNLKKMAKKEGLLN